MEDMASKSLLVTTDVYEGLRRLKEPGESFSDLLRRLSKGWGRIGPHGGVLADEPEAFFQGVRAAIERLDEASEAELRAAVRRGRK